MTRSPFPRRPLNPRPSHTRTTVLGDRTYYCTYCHGSYMVPSNATIDTFKTADAWDQTRIPNGPAGVAVRVNGQCVHECRRGVEVTNLA